MFCVWNFIYEFDVTTQELYRIVKSLGWVVKSKLKKPEIQNPDSCYTKIQTLKIQKQTSKIDTNHWNNMNRLLNCQIYVIKHLTSSMVMTSWFLA